MAENNRHLIVIAGPTAVGKTALSIKVAQHFNAEIISADSRQVYREMKIGTAVPDENQLAAVTHHFVCDRSVHEDFSAGDFEIEALELLDRLFEKHPIVVLCGGSGLYVKAVTHGFDEHPSDLNIRRQLIKDFQQNGIGFLQEKLLQLDPETYKRIDLHNHQRIIRALEVCIVSGKPYSSFLTHSEKTRPFRVHAVGLTLPREVLNQRIDQRVDDMVREGLVEEARKLYPLRHLNALQTVGYRELFNAFDGKVTQQEAISSIKTNTRRFAKRQMTWFRKYIDASWFNPHEEDQILEWLETKTGYDLS